MHYKIWKLKTDDLSNDSGPESEESELNLELKDDKFKNMNTINPLVDEQINDSGEGKKETEESFEDFDLVFGSTGRAVGNIVCLDKNLMQSMYDKKQE